MSQAKLKKAVEEIIAILDKNDLAGSVVLHTPGYLEYRNHWSPSYSCASIVGKTIEFKLNAVHYGGDKDKRNVAALETSEFLHEFANYFSGLAFIARDASISLDKELGISREPGMSLPE